MAQSRQPKRSAAELKAALRASLNEEAAGNGRRFRSGPRSPQLARELIILPRFERDYLIARKHPEFERETLEYIFDMMVAGSKLPGHTNNCFPHRP